MSGPIMKQSLGQNKFFFHFPYFWKRSNKLQGYPYWKCKKSQATLLFNHTEGMEHQRPEAKFQVVLRILIEV
jgi:hypothetical protein